MGNLQSLKGVGGWETLKPETLKGVGGWEILNPEREWVGGKP